jgi:phage shock protein PspC (stress-responsive transcriptional regulator)
MQPVIQVSLNRNPWHVEADAHARLEAYLAEAAAALADDPDRAEILLDLEQAIVDQCKRRMPARANVISLAELAPALEEIGPVRPPDAANAAADAAAHAAAAASASPPLQQISQGAWASGVCLGLARHLKVEVTLVRVVAVVLLFFTGGAALLLYGMLMLLLPFAPLDPQQPPPSRIPARLREWVDLIRGKLAHIAR